MKRTWLALALLGQAGCLRPAEDRVALDREVGRAQAEGVTVSVTDGLAAVRAFDGVNLTLWAQAPALELTLEGDVEPRALTLDVLNAMPGSLLSIEGEPDSEGTPLPDFASGLRFELTLPGGAQTLQLAPPDLTERAPFVFAVLSDVQSGIDDVHDIFERMNDDPELRFVVSTGDLVDTGVRKELVRFQQELEVLRIPFFSTVGNHELGAPPRHWHELFGPFSTHFTFQDVYFSLVDSANATIDPDMYDRLSGWLSDAREAAHVVVTHVPPLDPAGLRGGAFRSRKEAAKFVTMLGKGEVDALFLGHIHSYYAFENASIPSYISGGGGATQERFDGIERHYLRVRASAAKGIEDVAIVRID